MHKYVAVFIPAEEKPGAYCVEFPGLEGCFTEGDSLEEALDNARECLTSYLDASEIEGENFPVPQSLEEIHKEHGEKYAAPGVFFHSVLSHPLEK